MPLLKSLIVNFKKNSKINNFSKSTPSNNLDLWVAKKFFNGKSKPETLTTGFSKLDALLPNSGWPRAALVEFFTSSVGSGVLKLLSPALSLFAEREDRWITWINPPLLPYAPSLHQLNINTSKILLIHPKNHRDALWALENTAKSGACSVVLAWIDNKEISFRVTQRTQIASKKGQTLTCLFRPLEAEKTPSMAQLRMRVSNSHIDQLSLNIKKRRNGWPIDNVLIDLPQGINSRAVQKQLELWRISRKNLTKKGVYEKDFNSDRTMTSNSFNNDVVTD